ncbi:hypothetical protein ACOJBM_06595 [Rhizobium beringeri]
MAQLLHSTGPQMPANLNHLHLKPGATQPAFLGSGSGFGSCFAGERWIRSLLLHSLKVSQKHVREAGGLREEFEAWLEANGIAKAAEALIDPQNFRAWQQAREQLKQNAEVVVRNVLGQYTGVDGRRQSYDVLPIVTGEVVDWIDPAGYAVARSARADAMVTEKPAYHDFSVNAAFGVQILRTF